MDDPKQVVRRGYDVLSTRYDEATGADSKYRTWIGDLLARLDPTIARWLRPGGWFLCTTGDGAWTGTDENWLGGGAPMWWSHADAATYRNWLAEAGLTVHTEAFVPEGSGGHRLFWACR
ncbi:hypothetical protein [Kribbella sp. NPDC000426]|uniref:hypothetical protein n=1 Tax=Kribbella sp. NPDC000426 TaxID=3154255 RepID=UPI003324BB39